jgi:hypothetical protein
MVAKTENSAPKQETAKQMIAESNNLANQFNPVAVATVTRKPLPSLVNRVKSRAAHRQAHRLFMLKKIFGR